LKTKPSPSKRKQIAASGIPVHCSFSCLADIAALTPNPRNPNKHGDQQIALLAKIIKHQGWRSPITVSNRSGFVVVGHGRLEAAKLLQVEKVPVDYQDFVSEADEWAHLIADNRLSEIAEMDEAALSILLKDLDGQIDRELTGFAEEDLNALLAPDEPLQIESLNEQFMIVVTCTSEAQQLSLLERFNKEGLKCKALIS
jgi:ParB-like chromosome segregation protein Spo0J